MHIVVCYVIVTSRMPYFLIIFFPILDIFPLKRISSVWISRDIHLDIMVTNTINNNIIDNQLRYLECKLYNAILGRDLFIILAWKTSKI